MAVRSSPVVVGREVELEHIRRIIETSRAGQSSSTLIVGEGGVGKSRLLAEALAVARQSALAVAAGRAPISAPTPFCVVSEALRSWLRGHSPPRIDSTFDEGLRLVLPEWPSQTRALADLSAQQLRLLALEGVVTLLRHIAQSSSGVVLLLDDLHAADPDSIEVTRYVAGADIAGLAIFAALRPHESAVADELVRVLHSAQSATVLELEPLGSRAVAELVGSIVDAAPPAELVADVMSRTDGVPLLVEEVVDAHVRAGSVEVSGTGARWRGGSGVVVPLSVRGMVEARLQQVSVPLRAALEAAAVLARFDSTSLIGKIARVDEDVVIEALQTGVDAGLLASRGGAIVFRHEIIREAIIDATLPHVVQRLHRDAAAELDGAEQADHLAAAGNHDAAARAYVNAAYREVGKHALLTAEGLARRALSIIPVTSSNAIAADAVATVLAAQGRWAEALAIDEATVAESGHNDERRQRMASAALEAGFADRARTVLEGADARAPLTRVLLGRVALVGGDATAALVEADAVLDEPVDEDIRFAALDIKGRALDYLGNRAEARETWRGLAQEAASTGRTQAELRAVFQLGRQEFFSGGRPDVLRTAVELARRSGALLELAWAEETLAIALTVQGDPYAALQVLDAAIPRARELRLDQLAFLLIVRAGALSFTQESVDDLFTEAEALAPAPEVRMMALAVKSDVAVQRGRYADALAGLEESDRLQSTLPGAAPIDAASRLVWALAAVGRFDEARAAMQRAEALPDLSRWYMRPVLVQAGRCLLNGDASGLDAAIANAPGPMPFNIAIMRTIGAEVLGGATRVPWLRAALDIYESTGATVPRERVRQLLREAGGPVPRRRVPGPTVPDELRRRGVTAREVEVLQWLGQGASNADIASRLFVSVRTVETHVSSLLSKLDLRSRGQLTALSATISFEP